MTASRDLGLIVLTGILVMTAMICTTLLVIHANVDPAAAFGVITAGVGIGGVALGRLSGAGSEVIEVVEEVVPELPRRA